MRDKGTPYSITVVLWWTLSNGESKISRILDLHSLRKSGSETI
jgi:hypothetical protein